jgi:CRP-like cAMP-binding protein
MKNALAKMCDFVHQAQKERGSVALFLRSQGKEFSDELESQFKQMDKVTNALEIFAKSKSGKIEPLQNTLNYLPAKRKYITAKMIEPAEAINFYSREIISPAIEIIQETAVLQQDNQPAKVSAFINFLHWKERVGLERALGTQLVESNLSNAKDFRDKLEFIISEQQAYERMFLLLADNDLKAQVENLKNQTEIFAKIDNLHKAIINGKDISAVKIDALEWFKIFTAKIDILHEISLKMLASLSKSDVHEHAQAELVQVDDSVENSIKANLEQISALPLFAGLNSSELSSILKYARIVSHNKGSLIFMQGEQASRFFIILDGWVKLFKGNVDGQESILQVSTIGENLLDTVIFSDAPLPVNAQAVEKTKLLSIPASMLRERLKTNNTLAVNMISTVSGRSQALISQFEQLTLKTVNQRVGWFLLKLFMDNGERTKNLKLPYDKSLIAGYLGMKPETFSRTLQTLKEQGIDIERNSISLPDVFALCDFCDSELAEKCSKHNTPECPNPDCDYS